MKRYVLDGKRILCVDDEPDVLDVIEEAILSHCPHCQIQKASCYDDAVRLLESELYDLVILDIMGVRGFDLLRVAVAHDFHVVMLTAHALSPEALKRSFKEGARAYLPKEKLGDLVPFLNDIMTYGFISGWRRIFIKLKDFFDSRFG